MGLRPTTSAQPLSVRLRERSREIHGDAMASDYLDDLTAGRLDLRGYAALVVQHLFIYRALEGIAQALATDPAVRPFVTDELTRSPALQADLVHLLGPEAAAAAEPNAATRTYVARIEEMRDWPAGFVGHHYVRYLGDLSGGLAIGRLVAKHYGLAQGADGVRFYHFEQIPAARLFKDRYRLLLDRAPWSAAEQDRLLEEVLHAYRLNIDVLAELGRTVSRAAS